MENRNDNRLSVTNYLEAIEGVETQFGLIRFALRTLSKNEMSNYLKSRLNRELELISAGFAKVKETLNVEDLEGWDKSEVLVRDIVKKKHRKHSRPSDHRFRLELSEDRLNQSELLLLVAHFESFMKDIHRTFLMAAPEKVFGKSQKTFTLRDAFKEGRVGLSQFVTEQIIKEVKSLDSQGIEQRAKYFHKHFGVSFASEKGLSALKEIMSTRNRISHEIYNPPPRSAEHVYEQPLVSDQMLETSRRIFKEIPRKCVEAGAKVYQSYFR